MGLSTAPLFLSRDFCSQYRTMAVGLGPPRHDGGQMHLVCAVLSLIGLDLHS